MIRFPTNPIETVLRSMLALMVSISILQTPIPMAHVHSGIESHGELSAHLDRHHAEELRHAATLDWREVHWHLVIPGDFNEHQDDHESSPDAAPVVGVLVSNGSTAALDLDWTTERLPQQACDGLAAFSARAATDSSCSIKRYPLSPAQYTCAVLCVIRC